MKVKLVYGPPCGGKSTYVDEHAKKDDAIWDGDKVVRAITTKKDHSATLHKAQKTVMFLREKMVESLRYHDAIDTLWFCCRYPNDRVKEILDGLDVEEIPIIPTEEECYENLEKDDTRPDKDEWKKIIHKWYQEHSDNSNKRKVSNSMNKFWNWIRNEQKDEFGSERTLVLDGPISDSTWYGDEVTPQKFKDELYAEKGDITLWINSPGGDVFAAAQIYNLLMDYPYDITVKIDGIAASAASVIAMAGTKVCMSPVAMMMIHNPSTAVMGDASDLKDAIAMLNEVKESIINAYETKTLLDRDKLSRMMDNTTWMNARKALELNFCDEILFTEETKAIAASASAFSPNIVNRAFITKFRSNHPAEETKVSAEQLMNRLNLLAH